MYCFRISFLGIEKFFCDSLLYSDKATPMLTFLIVYAISNVFGMLEILNTGKKKIIEFTLDPENYFPTSQFQIDDFSKVLSYEVSKVIPILDMNLYILENGATIVIEPEYATLKDSDESFVGRINFNDNEMFERSNDVNNLNTKNSEVFNEYSDTEEFIHRNLRKLNSKKHYYTIPQPRPVQPKVEYTIDQTLPPVTEGQWNAYPSEMYCRYGCGNLMGVTFPYYYRPFFGYGFPLIGTEKFFTAGYGGNPLAAMGPSGSLAGLGSNHPAPRRIRAV